MVDPLAYAVVVECYGQHGHAIAYAVLEDEVSVEAKHHLVATVEGGVGLQTEGEYVVWLVGNEDDAALSVQGRYFLNDYIDIVRIARKIYPERSLNRLCDVADAVGLSPR